MLLRFLRQLDVPDAATHATHATQATQATHATHAERPAAREGSGRTAHAAVAGPARQGTPAPPPVRAPTPVDGRSMPGRPAASTSARPVATTTTGAAIATIPVSPWARPSVATGRAHTGVAPAAGPGALAEAILADAQARSAAAQARVEAAQAEAAAARARAEVVRIRLQLARDEATADAVVDTDATARARREAEDRAREARERWPEVQLWTLAQPAFSMQYTDLPEGSNQRYYGQCVAEWEAARRRGVRQAMFVAGCRNIQGEPITLSTFRGYQSMWKSHVASATRKKVVAAITDVMLTRLGDRMSNHSKLCYVSTVARCLCSFPDRNALRAYLADKMPLTTKRSTLGAIRAAMAVNLMVIPGLDFADVRRHYDDLSRSVRRVQGTGQRSAKEEAGGITKQQLREGTEALLARVPSEGEHTFATDLLLQRFVFWRMFFHYPCRLSMRTLVPNAASGNRLHIEGHRVVIELDDYKTVKTYGPQCFVISHEPTLVTQLRRLLEHREPGEPLFCTENRQLYELSAFSRFVTAAISEVVGKHVTVHIARKILAAASWPENPSRNAMERISRLVFQHSLSTHVAYNLGHAGAPAGDAASVHSDLEQSFSDESEDTEGA